MTKLALLLLLTGCASAPSLRSPRGYWQDRPALANDFAPSASAGQQAVEVDFEAVPPQQAEELRRRGVDLPRVSQRTADPRTHRDFADVRVTAIGFGITAGGYVLYCDGLQLPVLVPESQVDLGLTVATPLNASIYPDRDSALAAIAASVPPSRQSQTYAYSGNPRASARALKEAEPPPEAPLPAPQQQIRNVLLEEHPGLHPRVATAAARGGEKVQGPGVKGADVTLMNGGGREVTVHSGEFTEEALGGHLAKKASQRGTTEIYLQINSPGASREAFLELIPRLRTDYEALEGQFVRVFGPNGEAWWSGSFR